MAENKPNIAKYLNPLFADLGLEPTFVKQLTITPREVVAEIFKKNERGEKHTVSETRTYVDEDGNDVTEFGSRVATETLTFEVRT